ncbi:hypothetical protein PMIT1313_01892 [Prochlorococcus marinus str. MIT 1313]|uniref:hypothetical protein n=1 Tax=Prochlorococcus TaxID=1218 RepID=UPI0007BB2931|nr:hypothetical protein [Prochlorococcus marinus]KZR68279.1 hypothetical protein PMIT1313_01892 [Prochlorococcus marinus str. MIT 1313]KZR71482.1 hypothetical protein PMIT1318_02634 [Prochlorococcus marinus str. MIT 1318]
MMVSENQASFEKLLSKQLHGFSQLSEALILRLIQLEERVAILESSQFLKDDGCHEATKKLLVDSEERVRHLQGLLDVDPDRCTSYAISSEGQTLQEVKPENSESDQTFNLKTEDFQAEGNFNQCLENGDGTFDDDVGDTQCVEDAQTNLLLA